ncbi:MAG: CPBP family intramembrane glutamic endopeptidase [Dehalococcoidia bacterium]
MDRINSVKIQSDNSSILRLGALLQSLIPRTLRYPYLYTALIACAELITIHFQYWGGVAHFAILVALFLHSVLIRERFISDLLTAMACAPLIRILSLSTPLEHFSQISWFLVISIPVFITAFTVAHLQGLSTRDLGLTLPRLKHIPLELLVTAIGFGIGAGEYQLLKPNPLAEFNAVALLAPSLIMLVSTGFLEEFVFRGLIQHNAERLAGFKGIVLVSIIFGFLHITNIAVLDIFLATFAGLLFALVVRKTGSILGVSMAHGAANISLFLICPYLF